MSGDIRIIPPDYTMEMARALADQLEHAPERARTPNPERRYFYDTEVVTDPVTASEPRR